MTEADPVLTNKSILSAAETEINFAITLSHYTNSEAIFLNI